MSKYVYYFGDGKADGGAEDKNLLGGKGANLGEMTRMGIPVPPGFTCSTEVCTYYYDHGESYPPELEGQVNEALQGVEKSTGRKFGDPENALLLSVRSGARVSMNGMMDTVLNLGLCDKTIDGLAARGGERFAWDSYRRLIQMYGDVVMGVEHATFEKLLRAKREKFGVKQDNELPAEALRELVGDYKKAVQDATGKPFPQEPKDQLWGGRGAVFGSWNTARAVAYRELNGIPNDWGTAVNVQTMVFGNMGETSATGVAFTRDPATGEKRFYGEWLKNAQGEDVVAGIRTPAKMDEASRGEDESPSLEATFPELYKQLVGVQHKLEEHYRDMQDLEFTIQEGTLYLLQTRAGKRTGFAAFRIAADMVREGLITKEEALLRVDPTQLNQYLRPIFEAKTLKEHQAVAKGLNAGPGAATGRVLFTAEEAEAWAKRGEDVILVRTETSPEDIRGMASSLGILTSQGGMTSHAALVARQMGKVCVAGCGAVVIDEEAKKFEAGGQLVKEGDWISLNGSTGDVYVGKIPTHPSEVLQVLLEKTLKPEDSEIYRTYAEIMSWADEVRRLKVRTNADQPDQSINAIAFGAEGIGLCRTEHMFFEGERISSVRRMILASDETGRRKALAELLPMQRGDFEGLFEAMGDRPVTIRTLDPPLHEFLPHEPEAIAELAQSMEVSVEELKLKIDSLHEFNPMLGHRGCRLAIVYPEILEMQARAILEAACNVKKKGVDVKPEIMIPFVSHEDELRLQREVVDRAAQEVFKELGMKVDYLVGTMIELPRACLVADRVAQVGQFFSFGTNDLTQTTFGLSRDDAGRFLPFYVDKGILPYDPFVSVDREGMGILIEMGVSKGRSARPDLKVGICGEHGGDPLSVEFCHRVGFDYVSCSPFRVPIARLAAAQAVLKEKLDS